MRKLVANKVETVEQIAPERINMKRCFISMHLLDVRSLRDVSKRALDARGSCVDGETNMDTSIDTSVDRDSHD